MTHRILVAIHDPTIAEKISLLLNHHQYGVYSANNSESVIRQIRTIVIDLVLLDLGFSEGQGIEVCRTIRTIPSIGNVPIIMMTDSECNDTPASILSAGADDCIVYPFDPRELLARIRASLRWVSTEITGSPPLLRIIPGMHRVYRDFEEIDLTRIEFNLLVFLGEHPGRWYTAQELLETVWNYPNGVGDTALVRNHIRNLRRKLEADPDHPAIIQSRHGRGYTVQARVQFVEVAAR